MPPHCSFMKSSRESLNIFHAQLFIFVLILVLSPCPSLSFLTNGIQPASIVNRSGLIFNQPSRKEFHSCIYSSTQKSDQINKNNNEGVRLNKVLKETHSRREADALIESGRVTINGKPIGSKGGFKVIPYVDSVELDGKIVRGWEKMNGFYAPDKKTSSSNKKLKHQNNSPKYTNQHFEYIKYWKPKGVTCTTEKSVKSNIVHEIQRDGYHPKHRVYPVGRLDKDTTGLILLTSDGRLPNSVLRGEAKQPKIYEVVVDHPLKRVDIEQLRDGVVITTVAMRDRKKAPPLTARTLPCKVKQISPKTLQITLIEGRNRQVRKMLDALNYTVLKLHRIQFMGMSLEPLEGPGDWMRLSPNEMKLIENALRTTENKNIE